MSFFADKIVTEGLTFNVVMLIASNSEVLPCNNCRSSWVMPKNSLNTPAC